MDTKIKSKFLQVMISCEIRQQGLNILQALIEKQLAFGGPIFSGPAKFLWKSEIVEHDYCYIFTFTREDLKDDLIREAESVSVEAICMMSFSPLDGNKALMRILEDTFENRENKPKPKRKKAEAALTFVPASEISNRTKDSFGDLAEAVTQDPTR
jgi:hypothetical protein